MNPESASAGDTIPRGVSPAPLHSCVPILSAKAADKDGVPGRPRGLDSLFTPTHRSTTPTRATAARVGDPVETVGYRLSRPRRWGYAGCVQGTGSRIAEQYISQPIQSLQTCSKLNLALCGQKPYSGLLELRPSDVTDYPR
jgi:hypothetical protein